MILKQHYVDFENIQIPEKYPYLWQYDKANKVERKIYDVSKICYEKNLYEFKDDSGQIIPGTCNDLENYLSKCESKWNVAVNYPPLMRGIPRLEVGASAPWSFSFPAYEESSLQDDCNHPNLTISTGDPRRPVRFIHDEGLSFLCVRMSGCACHPFRLIQDILCCLLIPVHGMSAYRAEIRPVRQL